MMSKMITIKVSGQTALFLQTELKEHIFKKLHDADSLSNFDGVSELIAELRTLQKLIIASGDKKGAA
jgi:soluble P-type ATPase